MDYGSFLKKSHGNVARQSRHYQKQSAFQGSRRQLRGKVLRTLANGELTKRQLLEMIPDERLDSVLEDLRRETLITETDGHYTL